jgi:hypothetical protein
MRRKKSAGAGFAHQGCTQVVRDLIGFSAWIFQWDPWRDDGLADFLQEFGKNGESDETRTRDLCRDREPNNGKATTSIKGLLNIKGEGAISQNPICRA